LVSAALELLGYTPADLDLQFPPALIHGGADHLLLGLKTREVLAAMRYELAAGRELMREAGLVTILLAYAETPQRFHSRPTRASASRSSTACGGWPRACPCSSSPPRATRSLR